MIEEQGSVEYDDILKAIINGFKIDSSKTQDKNSDDIIDID